MVHAVRSEPDLSTRSLDDDAFGKLLEPILRTLHVNVGTDAIEQDLGRSLREPHDRVDTAQRGEQLRTIVETNERALRTLERADRVVVVEPDDQRVTLLTRPSEITDVAGVHQIETAIRENDAAPLSTLLLAP